MVFFHHQGVWGAFEMHGLRRTWVHRCECEGMRGLHDWDVTNRHIMHFQKSKHCNATIITIWTERVGFRIWCLLHYNSYATQTSLLLISIILVTAMCTKVEICSIHAFVNGCCSHCYHFNIDVWDCHEYYYIIKSTLWLFQVKWMSFQADRRKSLCDICICIMYI